MVRGEGQGREVRGGEGGVARGADFLSGWPGGSERARERRRKIVRPRDPGETPLLCICSTRVAGQGRPGQG